MNKMGHKFTIYPAIDLRAGQVVRLFQGDPAKQTVYGDDPAGVARHWLAAGARWLHVVNLDGAFGEPGQANQAALQAILGVVKTFPGARVQLGGGLRSLADIERALSAGVDRAILGTLAIKDPALAFQATFKTDTLGQWNLPTTTIPNMASLRGIKIVAQVAMPSTASMPLQADYSDSLVMIIGD